MSRSATRALIDWMPVNERIIMARFYSKHIKLTTAHVYAPTEDAEELVKDEFYRRLQDVLNAKKEHDMLIVTGDMNVKVSEDCDFNDMNKLVITGILFPCAYLLGIPQFSHRHPSL